MNRPALATRIHRFGLAAVLALLLYAAPAGLMLASGGGRAWAQQPRRFEIAPATSEITVLLFKEGLFAGFAHDHVLVNNSVTGEILLHGADGSIGTKRGTATAKLSMPVDAFLVDTPEHRKREKHTGELSEEDRGEIRGAMLGPEQLDAAGHPRITAVVELIEGEWPLVTALTTITIRGGVKQLAIPLKAELTEHALAVSGEFEARHSDFGIDPFSSFLGAVAVKDKFKVRFRIEAGESP